MNINERYRGGKSLDAVGPAFDHDAVLGLHGGPRRHARQPLTIAHQAEDLHSGLVRLGIELP